MLVAEDIKNTFNDIVSSYEIKIRSVGAIFDTTYQLLQTFQESFLDTKQQRENLKAQLQENLARNGSLRKKDFDNMMQEILSNQERGEKEVRDLLNSYLNGQKAMAHTLSNTLAKVKDALAKDQVQRAREFQAVIKEILAKQEKRKQLAIFKLRGVQQEQRQIAKRLEGLLAKGRKLRTKDLKLMLAEFKRENKTRTYQQGRNPVVEGLSGGYQARHPKAANK
jgi:hypothetical protein